MFDLRSNGISAGAAFILSFLIGLLSRSTMPTLIIRPLIFAGLFFVLSVLIRLLISRFLPELQKDGGQADDGFQLGSRIDITEGGDSQADSLGHSSNDSPRHSAPLGQPVLGARPDDSEDEIGDISDLASRISSSAQSTKEIFPGMDQKTEEDYNKAGTFGVFSEPTLDKIFVEDSFDEAPATVEQAVPSEDTPKESVQTKPAGGGATGKYRAEETLPDLDSMAMAFMSTSSEEEPEVSSFSGPVSPKKSSTKAPPWADDFNPKDIAKGLQTVLIKDKEG